MAYVNERISDEDMVKYRIDEMAWGYQANLYRSWVIDRERDIYLRRASDDRGETNNEYWSFYWKGHQWPVYGTVVSYVPKTETELAQCTLRLKFTKFPPQLIDKLPEIHTDFKDAYQGFYSKQKIKVDMTFIF